MEYRELCWESFARKDHFSYFSSMQNPYVGVTVETDIGELPRLCRETGTPFFLTVLYAVSRAANAVPQLRQRIVNGRPVEFDRCDTSHTVLRPDGTYGYCRLREDAPFEEFLLYARPLHEAAKHSEGLKEEDDLLGCFFVSSLPWISFSSLVQPTPTPADSNPRIVLGKYVQNGLRWSMPVAVLANHALVDGVHLAAFYDALAAGLSGLEDALRGKNKN